MVSETKEKQTRTIIFFIFIFFISCNSNDTFQQNAQVKNIDSVKDTAQTKRNSTEINPDSLYHHLKIINTLDSPYYYKDQVGPTRIKGGYELSYAADDSSRYLFLKNGNSVHLLDKAKNYSGSYYSLGTLGEDHADFFTIIHDNGNGNPSDFEIFDKKTGENILGKDSLYCSSLTFKDTLFLLSYNLEKKNLTLFNVIKRTREYFELPNDLPEAADIQLDKVSNKNLTIIYYDVLNYGKPGKRKTYKR
ncbi:MAG: hypothetical protein HY064_16430 [Bacteroidetes bacterium]|nr:hypothetical protein [Bacteroidota bacterium]